MSVSGVREIKCTDNPFHSRTLNSTRAILADV